MPRQTKKDAVIDTIYCNAIFDLIDLNSSDESEIEEIETNVLNDLHIVKKFRFGDITKVPKQKTWLRKVLPNYDELRFKEVTRVTFAEFDMIYNLIKDNEVFKSIKQQQMDESVQLAITLYRLGSYGSGACIANIARIFGVGDGSTIVRITRRVFRAILSLENQFIFWPSKEERAEIIGPAISDSLPKCVGFIDGTRIELDEAPYNKEAYFDKDKNYSLQLQLISDHQRKIRNYVVGYPGSCHDSRIWNECNLSKHPDLYFSEDEWLCGDKGYGLCKVIITPFRINTPDVSLKDQLWFNKYFSSNRVIIEHLNGNLKETFQSLKKLKVKINNENGHSRAMDWIRVCLILYNMILPTGFEDVQREQRLTTEQDEEDAEIVDDFDASDKRMALFYFVKEKLGK